MAEHELKVWPSYFAAIRDGTKRFEWRKDDRGYRVGDALVLREWSPDTETYTGEVERREVTYIARGAFGIPADFCIMSIGPEGVAPCGGSRCFKRDDGRWCHSSKSYDSCAVEREGKGHG